MNSMNIIYVASIASDDVPQHGQVLAPLQIEVEQAGAGVHAWLAGLNHLPRRLEVHRVLLLHHAHELNHVRWQFDRQGARVRAVDLVSDVDQRDVFKHVLVQQNDEFLLLSRLDAEKGLDILNRNV